MKKQVLFTDNQMEELAKYERFFRQAQDARFCSWPGRDGLDQMLAIWNAATGEGRRIMPGCGECLFHLVYDVSTLYYAQKTAQEAAKAAEAPAAPKKAKSPAKPKQSGKTAKK